MSAVCPRCHSRMAADARFCMACGGEVAPQSLAAAPVGAACPRCDGGLRTRSLDTASVVECGACGGFWLAARDLDRLCEEADRQGLALRQLAERPKPARAVETNAVRYLACIRCGDRMVRRNFGGSSGIILDVCRDHGVWLDHSEIEKALAFARTGGLMRARRLELERLRAETDHALARRGSSAPMSPSAWPRDSLETGIDLAAGLSWLSRALLRWWRR